jgi:murein DD-endopeptidase MepM/ murein hydrolase activator NlpD
VVKRIGYPYSQSSEKAEYRLIELEVDEQTLVRYFYVYPSVIPGEHIKRGAVLGIVQDITKHFTGMTPHYHFEVLIEGQHVNPNLWLTNYARYPAINSSDRRD